MEEKNQQTQPKPKKQRRISAGMAAALLFLALLLFAFVFIVHSLNLIGRSDHDRIRAEDETFETDAEGEDTVSPSDVGWSSIESLNDEELLNILLVGQDRRPSQGRQRSDSMIVVSMNTETREISMVSFLRDLYVRIPGYSDNRMNAAYAFGGFDLLKETLMLNFGVSIDACFEVDFDGFENVIDAIGGVDVELTNAEARIVGGGAYTGQNHLNGKQALAYARIRKIDSDFNRTQRQRNIMLSVFETARKSSLPELIKLADALIPQLTTDQTNTQIIALLTEAYAVFHDNDQPIESYHVPASNAYYNATIRGMMVLVPNLQMIHGQLQEYLPLPEKKG